MNKNKISLRNPISVTGVTSDKLYLDVILEDEEDEVLEVSTIYHENSKAPQQFIIEGSTKFCISGLQSNKIYSLESKISCKSGLILDSKIERCTLDDELEIPNIIITEGVNRIKIKFERNKLENLTYYCEMSESRSSYQEQHIFETDQYIINRLKSDTEYNLKYMAKNSTGKESKTKEITFKTGKVYSFLNSLMNKKYYSEDLASLRRNYDEEFSASFNDKQINILISGNSESGKTSFLNMMNAYLGDSRDTKNFISSRLKITSLKKLSLSNFFHIWRCPSLNENSSNLETFLKFFKLGRVIENLTIDELIENPGEEKTENKLDAIIYLFKPAASFEDVRWTLDFFKKAKDLGIKVFPILNKLDLFLNKSTSHVNDDEIYLNVDSYQMVKKFYQFIEVEKFYALGNTHLLHTSGYKQYITLNIVMDLLASLGSKKKYQDKKIQINDLSSNQKIFLNLSDLNITLWDLRSKIYEKSIVHSYFQFLEIKDKREIMSSSEADRPILDSRILMKESDSYNIYIRSNENTSNKLRNFKQRYSLRLYDENKDRAVALIEDEEFDENLSVKDFKIYLVSNFKYIAGYYKFFDQNQLIISNEEGTFLKNIINDDLSIKLTSKFEKQPLKIIFEKKEYEINVDKNMSLTELRIFLGEKFEDWKPFKFCFSDSLIKLEIMELQEKILNIANILNFNELNHAYIHIL